MKPGSTLVLGETDPELAPIFLEPQRGDVLAARPSTSGCARNELAHGGRLRRPLHARRRATPTCFLPLHGAHQADNAAIALAAAEAFLGAPLDDEVVADGVRRGRVARAARGRAATSRSCCSTARTTSPAREALRGRARRRVPAGAAHARRRAAAREGPARDARGARRRPTPRASSAAGRRARARSTPSESPTRPSDLGCRRATGSRSSTTSPTRSRARSRSPARRTQVVVTGSLYVVGAARASAPARRSASSGARAR